MKVSEVMTRNPACCWLSSSALAAALMMKERETGILPVTQDPFTPRLVGVVTDRDLCLHAVAGGRDPAYIWIRECLTQDPVCCNPEDDVHHALELMKEYRVRRLPVVNVKREIVGMLSLSDLARSADIDSREIVTALQKICEPGPVTRGSPERTVTAA